MARRRSATIDTRIIYCADCLDQLKELPSGCVDLIYIDPPFNSNRNYEVFWGEDQERRRFEDRHESTQAYIDFMRPRCAELYRVLKKTGSFYYHCDWHASHYVKVMLDKIFGENNFQTEIIWRRNPSKGLAFKAFPNNHDSIFYYGAGGELTFNRQYIAYDLANLDEKTKSKYSHRDPDGRLYQLDNLTNPNPDRPNLTYEFLGVKKVWRWTRERMQKAYEDGIVVQPSPGSIPRLKRYLDEQEGRPIDSVWTDIPPLNSQAAERLGYPTQKPVALLNRIIKASSDDGQIVLDAFCGCGTTLAAAEGLNRQWIGIDVSPNACSAMSFRLQRDCPLKEGEREWREGKGFIIRDSGWTEEKLRAIPPFEFEKWAVIALGGIPNKAQVGDMGIDGRIYPVRGAEERKAEKGRLDLRGDTGVWYPVQVKQRDKAGRPDIDAFETAITRDGQQKGFFVAFDFSRDATQETDRFFRLTGKIIILLTVKEILEERIAHKLA